MIYLHHGYGTTKKRQSWRWVAWHGFHTQTVPHPSWFNNKRLNLYNDYYNVTWIVRISPCMWHMVAAIGHETIVATASKALPKVLLDPGSTLLKKTKKIKHIHPGPGLSVTDHFTKFSPFPTFPKVGRHGQQGLIGFFEATSPGLVPCTLREDVHCEPPGVRDRRVQWIADWNGWKMMEMLWTHVVEVPVKYSLIVKYYVNHRKSMLKKTAQQLFNRTRGQLPECQQKQQLQASKAQNSQHLAAFADHAGQAKELKGQKGLEMCHSSTLHPQLFGSTYTYILRWSNLKCHGCRFIWWYNKIQSGNLFKSPNFVPEPHCTSAPNGWSAYKWPDLIFLTTSHQWLVLTTGNS